MNGEQVTPTGDAVDAIRNAIVAADYAHKGVPCGPFLMAAVSQGKRYPNPAF